MVEIHGEKYDKFFPWILWHPLDYNAVMPYSSRFVTLRRSKPGDSITIRVSSSPNVNVTPITIEGEPNPESCQPAAVRVDLLNQPLHVDVKGISIDDDKCL